MDWDQNKVEELAKLLDKYNLTEVEVQSGESRIMIKKGLAPAQNMQGGAIIGYSPTGISHKSNADFRRITERKAELDELDATKAEVISENNNKTADSAASEPNPQVIVSPMAGIFYRQSKPGNPPYVEIGQKVKKGDVVCLVEAMKMINEISSNLDGVVKEFLVKNEQFVECGSPLVLIEEE